MSRFLQVTFLATLIALAGCGGEDKQGAIDRLLFSLSEADHVSLFVMNLDGGVPGEALESEVGGDPELAIDGQAATGTAVVQDAETIAALRSALATMLNTDLEPMACFIPRHALEVDDLKVLLSLECSECRINGVAVLLGQEGREALLKIYADARLATAQ